MKEPVGSVGIGRISFAAGAEASDGGGDIVAGEAIDRLIVAGLGERARIDGGR
jgi:hypothetical protein